LRRPIRHSQQPKFGPWKSAWNWPSASPRFTAWLIGVLSATAFILAAVGIYGVIAYSVAQGTQALGAETRIPRLVIGNDLRAQSR